MMMVLPVLAPAQEKPADNMQFVIEKIRADKQLFVAENMKIIHWITFALLITITATLLVSPGFTKTALAGENNTDIAIALEKLYAKSETARAMGEKAKGILVFP